MLCCGGMKPRGSILVVLLAGLWWLTHQTVSTTLHEAAEAALDAYLIKPYTSANLAERLASARLRKPSPPRPASWSRAAMPHAWRAA